MTLSEKIQAIQKQALDAIASTKSEADLKQWENTFLGRKSEFNTILKGLKDLNPEERRGAGTEANNAKKALYQAFLERREHLAADSNDYEGERIDVTLPGTPAPLGHLHPITLLEHEIEDIFATLGFGIVDGPELEDEWHNFDALNVPANHPARDMQDTFWVAEKYGKKKYLPRTQTSNVQIHYMSKHKPPFRVVVPGRIFRNEATDASHEHTFHQFECLMVGDDVSVAHFKYVAELFFEKFFGKKVPVRLRPSFFPFTEPSFEFDIRCILCNGTGCSVCKGGGWLEIGGAGMVQQKVFEAVGYPRGRYQGFAWGFGLTRLAMMKYGISDIRLFMSGDLRFIRQF